MSQKYINILISINSENYSSTFIENLNDKVFGSECYVSLVIMGPNATKVSKSIKLDYIKHKVEIPSVCYNFSYSINCLIKILAELNKIQKDDFLLITDGNTIPSGIKTNKYTSNMNPRDFLIINIIKEPPNSSINLESSKMMLTVQRRCQKLNTDKDTKIIKGLPCITLGSFLYLGGFNEEIFTEDVSRLYFIEKAFSQFKNVDNDLLALRVKCIENDVIRKQVEVDNVILKNTRTKNLHEVILDDTSKDFGNPKNFIYLKLYNDSIPHWSYKKQEPNISYNEINPEKNITLQNEIKNEIVEVQKPDENNFQIKCKKENILIMMDNSVEDVISTTPLIRKYYMLGCPPTLLLNTKINLNLHISHMVKEVYGVHDINRVSKIDFNSYTKIFKTHKCNIKLSDEIKITKNIFQNNLVETNYIKTYKEESIPPPYCYCPNKNIKLPDNYVVVFGSANNKEYRIQSEEYWKTLNLVMDNLHNTNINTFIILNNGEFPYLFPKKYKNSRNVFYEEKCESEDARYIIKNSSLCLSHPYSENFWYSYGLKKYQILMTDIESQYPIPTNHFNGYNVSFETSITDRVDNILNCVMWNV